MNGRRAVIWLKSNQTFEMIFQNRYTGDAKGFAWIIPLPGVPTKTDQPTANFLDELDRLTAPMIEKRSCTIPCQRGWATDAGVALPGSNTQPPDVTVWGSGKLGDLEYVTLSSTKSKDLLDWLTARGFNMDLSLQAIVDTYIQKGFVFFAAKLAATSTKMESVPVVRFTFDSTKTPVTYPVRISAFNRASRLRSVIWVVAEDGTHLPTNYPTARVTGSEHTKQSYEAALEALHKQNSGRTLVVQYAGRLDSDYNRRYLSGWSAPEMQALMDYKTRPYIVRLSGDLEPLGMNADLELKRTTNPESVSGWFQTPCPGGVVQESCDADPSNPSNPNNPKDGAETGGCQLSPSSAGPLALPLLLVGLVALLGRRRQRQR